jgi:N-acetylneuraminic acid mutarotase
MGSSTGIRRFAVALGIAALALTCTASASASPVFSKLPAEMLQARYAPIAALLPNGKVLIAGGYNETGKYMKTAEAFNPATASFEKLSAEMNVGREQAAYAVLPDGKVLIAGGYNSLETPSHLTSAELFNPSTNTFETLSAKMTAQRTGAAATLLPNGNVLLAGGYNQAGEYPTTTELFHPGTKTFEALSAVMPFGRWTPDIATLPSGKVLIAGGYNIAQEQKSAELFDPATNTFAKLEGELNEPREEAGYTTLASGKVLIVGGYNKAQKRLATTELFNPETNTFETLPTGLAERRNGPAAVLLPGGKVLVLGGYNETNKYLKSAELSAVTAPAAITAAASSIGLGTATLNGSVLAETSSTAYFQYGTTTAYGATTAPQSVAASIPGRPVSAPVSGLAPGTTYHYRVIAENPGGPGYGTDQTFNTVAAPVVVKATPPNITAPSQTHRVWRAGNKLAHVSKRAPLGTTFSFTLNEQATVVLTFTQNVAGRTVKHRCVAQTNANRRKHYCKRTLTRGLLPLAGHPGLNKVAFQGRISRTLKLKPGTYILMILATNSVGQHSTPTRLTFTIVK